MDPELLKYLANMTPEQLMEAIRSGQLAGTSGIQPAPGTPAASASPWTPGVGLKVTEGQPIPMAAIREGAQFGDAATAVRPVPQALPGPIPAPGSPQFAAAQTLAPAGEAALLQNQPVMGAGPKIPPGMPSGVNFVRPEGLVRADGPAMRAPLPRAGAQPLPPPPSVPGVPMSDPSLSAVRPKPFGLGDLLEADRPGPVAAAGAPVRPAPMSAAPPAPIPGSMPQLPGMSGISQVEGAFGAGQSAQADALRQYLNMRGGQPGLAGAASGAGMGSPIPTPGSVPGVPGTAPGVPPLATQVMQASAPAPAPPAPAPAPTSGAAGGAAPAASRFSKVLGAVRPAVRGILGTAGTAATAYGLAKDAGNLAGKALDARDPSLSPIENFGRGVAAVGSEFAPLVMPQTQPTREEMLADPAGTFQRMQRASVGGNVPLFRYINPAAVATTSAQALGGLAEQALNWAITRPGAERFQDAQPGTAATIRAAMDSGQSGQSRGAPAFDMGNPKPADPGATPPAPPAVRPATPGGPRKRPAAPAIPQSPETGVSDGSPGAGPSPYKLLGKDLQLPDTGSGISAVRPGGAGGVSSSPSPTGSWRDKGYTAMLNDKRGVMGEGRRMPLGAGPGEGARYGLDTEMKGNLASSGRGPGLSFRPETGTVTLPTLDRQGWGESDETEEEKQARLAAARAQVAPIFAGYDKQMRIPR